MMQKNKQSSFDIRSESKQNNHAFNQKKDVQSYIFFEQLQEINLLEWFKHLFLGINKLFIYFKYKLLKHSGGFFETNQVPWLKIGFVFLALFVLFKKDMQFSVNMKAPKEAMEDDKMEDGKVVRTAHYQEFGMSPSLSLLDHPQKKTVETKETSKHKNMDLDINEEEVINYVRRFNKTAKDEMGRFGIPASIKLAQGILESRANQNPKTKETNNHFGQPMSAQAYQNAWENWRAHSLFLTNSGFRTLLSYQKDVEKWAKGLQQLGYSKDRHYADKLMWLIVEYDLTHFDT